MKILKKIYRFFQVSNFEKKYFLEGLYAEIISKLFYRSQFGALGVKSWLKSPRQVVSPRNIFIGNNVRVESNAVLYSVGKYGGVIYNGKITIGDNVYINHTFNATCSVEIVVGEGVAFGPNVFLCDFDHGYEDISLGMIESPLISKGSINIGAKSWIGANVYIASGVQLGSHCTVAANSVVTKSFPPNSVIAGIPAKLIKFYNESSGRWEVVAKKSV